MRDAIIVAIITGACTIIVQLIISRTSSSDLFAKLNGKLEKHQAVTDTKIDELTREVREHNNFARRVPVLEEQIKQLQERR